MSPNEPEDLVHHRGGELARVRVLPARVIAPDERAPIRQNVRAAMSEPRAGAQPNVPVLEQPDEGIERDSAERHDDAHPRQRSELGIEVRQAIRDLLGRRPVVGRRASHRGGDERSAQPQSVARVMRCGHVRET